MKDYTFNGKTMNGYKVSDKNDDTKFIFLPAAGIFLEGYSYVYDQGNYGDYWSADDERCLDFGPGNRNVFDDIPINGMAVRPVSE